MHIGRCIPAMGAANNWVAANKARTCCAEVCRRSFPLACSACTEQPDRDSFSPVAMSRNRRIGPHLCTSNLITLLTAITAELRGRAFLDLLPMPNWRAGLAWTDSRDTLLIAAIILLCVLRDVLNKSSCSLRRPKRRSSRDQIRGSKPAKR